jgi:hypothetical protein
MTTLPATIDERRMRIIAREIALDFHPIENILSTYKITEREWNGLQRNPRFATLLREAVEQWNSALSTKERVELKALGLIEANLETAQEMLVDKSEPASARVEMMKTIARIAKVGEKENMGDSAGQRVNITINMGDRKLNLDDVTSPGNLIEGEAVDA